MSFSDNVLSASSSSFFFIIIIIIIIIIKPQSYTGTATARV